MNSDLLARFNHIVGPNDIVYHLGDVAMNWRIGLYFLELMNGRKHLIAGNHDRRQIKEWEGWESVQKDLVITDNGYTVNLSHYPPEHDGRWPGDIFLHGHRHSPTPNFMNPPNVFDVGVDANNMAPVTLEELLSNQSRRMM